MAKTYSIPNNFIESGKMFGGTIGTRNFVEALILGGVGAFLSGLLPITSTQIRIYVLIFCIAPGFLLGLFGINNDPVSTFLRMFWRWYKNRKIMLFNAAYQGRSDDIVEKMMAQKTPQEILANKVTEMKNKGEYKMVELIEGVNFEFEQDEELTKYT